VSYLKNLLRVERLQNRLYSEKLRPSIVIAIACFIFLFFLIIKLSQLSFFKNTEQASYDYYQNFFPLIFSSSPVKIVSIDEKSIEKLGQFPWPRTIFSEIITKVGSSGSIVIGFDILITEEDRTSLNKIAEQYKLDKELFKEFYFKLSNDQILSNNLRKFNVILSTAPLNKFKKTNNDISQKFTLISSDETNKDKLYFYPSRINSLEILERNAKGIGNVSYVASEDGVVRQIPLLIKIGDSFSASLDMEMLRVALGSKQYEITGVNNLNTINIGNFSIPINQRAEKRIYYKQYLEDQFISAVDIIENNFEPSIFQNSIVYIGATAIGLDDIVATPTNPLMSGVEVRANVLENILNNINIYKPQWTLYLEVIELFVLVASIIYITLFFIPLAGIGIFLLLQFIFILKAFLFFKYQYILIDYSFNLMFSFLVLASSYYYTYIRKNFLEKIQREKKEKFEKEMNFAGEIQSYLLPTEHPENQLIYGINIPARQVSGDYYDYIYNQKNELIFTLADVSGKGAASGLVMSKAASLFRLFAQKDIDLEKIILEINKNVCDRIAKGMFITMVIGKYNKLDNTLEMINAGHEPVMIISKDSVNYVSSSFRPVGIIHTDFDEKIESHIIQIDDPTKLFIYTDGVTEGYIDDNKTELGQQGVEDLIRKNFDNSLEIICDEIVKKLTNTSLERRDDITCLALSLKLN